MSVTYVKIIGCSEKHYWYADYIGDVFEVKEELSLSIVGWVSVWQTPEPEKGGHWAYVREEDCKVITTIKTNFNRQKIREIRCL